MSRSLTDRLPSGATDTSHREVPVRWWAHPDVRIMGMLLLAAAILFFAGLGRGTLWDQDEPRYAEAAREILQTGDPITLHINGTPWFVHPPLYIWLQALTGWAFGFNEFTVRVWSAIFGVVGVLITYALGRLFFSVRGASLGAVVLMTMLQYYAQARLGIFDIALVVFMLATVYTFIRALRDPSRHRAVWAFAWAGLGTLTKGPVAVLLPALALMGWLWMRGELHRLRQIPWRSGLLVYVVIAVPWYALETERHGWPFLRSVIGYYTITRFVGVVENQAGPWWYYGPVLLAGAFPWSGFLFAMVAHHLRRWREEGSALVLLWCGITLLFYTAARTKLPNYILPIYPMAALGIGVTWDRALSADGRARQALGVAFALTLVVVVIIAGGIRAFGATHYPADFAVLQHHLTRLAAAVLGGLLVATACYYGLRRPLAAFVVLAGMMVGLASVLTYRTLPLVDAHRPIKALASAARAELRPEDALIGLRLIAQQTLMYYANHHVEWIEDPAVLGAALCRHPRAVIVTSSDEYRTWATRAIGPSGRVLAEQDGLIAVLKDGPTSCDPASRR